MSRKRTPKRPNAEDLAIWNKVAETTTPLSKRPKQVFDVGDEGPPAAPAPKPKKTAPTPAFRIGDRAQTAAIPAARTVKPAPDMDSKAYRKLKQGKLTPDAKIDLHGMTLDVAHGALNRFILSAHAAGDRLVLVITGKGKPRDTDFMPTPTGVLRHHVPQWLQSPALRPAVLEVVEAHRRHGGSGAYYVYLRRRR
ncbi:MAG: Smr/MutS family protein [Pseudomonadota bacterium]